MSTEIFLSLSPYHLGRPFRVCSVSLSPVPTELPSSQPELTCLMGQVGNIGLHGGEGKRRREFSQLLIPLLQPHSDTLRPVLGEPQPICSPCPIILPPLKKTPKCLSPVPSENRQIYSSPLSDERLRTEQLKRLQLLCLPLSFPSLPLHKLNPPC